MVIRLSIIIVWRIISKGRVLAYMRTNLSRLWDVFAGNTKKQILERAETNRNLICTNCPLYRPEGGTIIVYDCALYPRRGLSDEQVRKTFRVDGYRWGCSKGVHRLKNGLQKRYTCLYEKDNAHGDKSFMWVLYRLIIRLLVIIVDNKGDGGWEGDEEICTFHLHLNFCGVAMT